MSIRPSTQLVQVGCENAVQKRRLCDPISRHFNQSELVATRGVLGGQEFRSKNVRAAEEFIGERVLYLITRAKSDKSNANPNRQFGMSLQNDATRANQDDEKKPTSLPTNLPSLRRALIEIRAKLQCSRSTRFVKLAARAVVDEPAPFALLHYGLSGDQQSILYD